MRKCHDMILLLQLRVAKMLKKGGTLWGPGWEHGKAGNCCYTHSIAMETYDNRVEEEENRETSSWLHDSCNTNEITASVNTITLCLVMLTIPRDASQSPMEMLLLFVCMSESGVRDSQQQNKTPPPPPHNPLWAYPPKTQYLPHNKQIQAQKVLKLMTFREQTAQWIWLRACEYQMRSLCTAMGAMTWVVCRSDEASFGPCYLYQAMIPLLWWHSCQALLGYPGF